MSYTKVFMSLEELFPQVDKRILKAASIEHASDPDAAVEFILLEVLPYIPEPTQISENFEDIFDHETEGFAFPGANKGSEEASTSSISPRPSTVHSNGAFPYKNDNHASNLNKSDLDDSQCLYNSIVRTPPPRRNGSNHLLQTKGAMSQSSSSESRNWDLSVLIANNRASSQNRGSDKRSDKTHVSDSGKHSEQSHDKVSGNCSDKVGLKGDETNRSNGGDNSSVFESKVITRSTHSVNAGILEDIVSDAKISKTSLLASIEMLTTMLNNVAHLEEKAKSTKEEASTAGQNTLGKVEDLRQTLIRAKEANSMNAGEVYGERSILSTEARELQSRLLSLSDEKNKSLEIIEEIRQALEVRLASAEEEIMKAENERSEREEMAQRVLKEQEEMMNAIVEESKMLQEEAEENAKLREFLVDRGHMVDSLQGEIAVICEDVSRLKQIVDGHLPMTRSVLSTISSLSSSTSSSVLGKNTASLHGDAETINSAENNVSTEKTSDGDGWELFEAV